VRYWCGLNRKADDERGRRRENIHSSIFIDDIQVHKRCLAAHLLEHLLRFRNHVVDQTLSSWTLARRGAQAELHPLIELVAVLVVVGIAAVHKVRPDTSSSLLLLAQVDGCDLPRNMSGVVVVRAGEVLDGVWILVVVVGPDLGGIGVDVFSGCKAGGEVMDASAQRPDVGGFGVDDGNFWWLPVEGAAGIATTCVGFAIDLADAEVVQLEGRVGGANVDHQDVSGLDVAVEENFALAAIRADLVLEECQSLAYLEEKAPDEAFWHRLVVFGVELRLLPLAKVTKSIVLVECRAMVGIRLVEDIVNRRHYSVAAWNCRNGLDFARKVVVVVVGVDWQHLLDDLLALVGDLHQERHVVREDGLPLPLTCLPDEGLSGGGGGGLGALATATSASSGGGGFAFSHGVCWE
jgi:hypothetical protein